MHFLKKYAIFLFVVAFVFTSCKKDPRQQELQLVADLIKINNHENLNFSGYDDLKDACTKIGHRATGTLNGTAAEEYIYNQLKKMEIDVRYDSFEVVTWHRQSLKFIVDVYHNLDTISAVSLAFSPESADLTGKLVDVGNGLDEDFFRLKDAVTSNIVLVDLHLTLPIDSVVKNLHRSEKTALAIKYGATGVVFVNKYPGKVMLTGTASVDGNLIAIPAICISMESGKYIRSFINSNKFDLKCKITMTNKIEKKVARNVIATFKGKDYPENVILVGGHLDSWDLATGAIDNGIGAFAILDVAKSFKKMELETSKTLKFAFWMGEELGLKGSSAYVMKAKAAKNLEHIQYYINLDMAGNPKGFNLEGREEYKPFIEKYAKRIYRIDSVFPQEMKNKVYMHSDNENFALEGIPTLQLISNLDPKVYDYYHSNKDHFELVNKDHMKYTGQVLAQLLYQMANDDSLKTKHLNSQEVKKFYVEAGHEHALRLSKKWFWE